MIHLFPRTVKGMQVVIGVYDLPAVEGPELGFRCACMNEQGKGR
jgi:hypothetical protein